MLRRPGENVDWLPSLQNNSLPHDGPVPPDRENKHYFSPNRFYCVETVCSMWYCYSLKKVCQI